MMPHIHSIATTRSLFACRHCCGNVAFGTNRARSEANAILAWIPFAVVFALVAVSPARALPLKFETLIKSGDALPGSTLGEQIAGNGTASISPDGTVVIRAGLFYVIGEPQNSPGGVSSNDDAIILVGQPGNLQTLVREDMPAPGLPAGVKFGDRPVTVGASFGTTIVNRQGEVFLSTKLRGTGVDSTNEQSAWIGTPGNLQKVYRQGDVAPGTTHQFKVATGLGMNDAGEVLFSASLQGSGVNFQNDAAIWTGQPGNLQLLLRKGDPVPGISGKTWGGVGDALINQHGMVAVGIGMIPGDEGLFVFENGSPTMIARRGQAAPGIPGFTFSNFESGSSEMPSINSQGEVAFLSVLDGAGAVQFHNDRGVWRGVPGNLELVARAGDPAPTGNPNEVFFNTPDSVSINAQGDVAFFSSFIDPSTGTGGRSLFVASRNGDITMVGAESSIANQYAFNNQGQLVFEGPSQSYYVYDPDEGVQLLAQVGQPFELAPGDVRTVNSVLLNISSSAGRREGGLASPLNDAGELVFGISFTDNTASVLMTKIGNRGDSISAGTNSSGEILGGVGQPGGVKTVMDVESGGTLLGSFEVVSSSNLGDPLSSFTFGIPGTDVQLWELEFDGTLSGPASVTFRYDESLLPSGFNEHDLAIYHYIDDMWTLENGDVDPEANTITVAVGSFSPFALGTSGVSSIQIIPEPSTLTLFSLGLIALVKRKRRRTA